MDPITAIEIKAVHAFVTAEVPIPYEGRISRIMRTITEAVHFKGTYYPSTEGKRRNLIISRRAALLISSTTRIEFPKLTILEHTLPLVAMYEKLLGMGPDISVEEVNWYFATTMRECPLVTVTKEEDRKLRNNRLSPVERYLQANIEIGTVEEIIFGQPAAWTPFAGRVEVVAEDQALIEDEPTTEAAGISDRRGHMSWGARDVEFE